MRVALQGVTRSKRLRLVPPPSPFDEALRPMSKLEKGHATYRAMRRDLETFESRGWVRTLDQILVSDAILEAVSPLVYGVDVINEHEEEIRRVNGFKTVDQTLMIMAMRRAGKTVIVSIASCVILRNVPGVVEAIFSVSMRSAGQKVGMLGTIADMLVKVFDMADVLHRDKESITYTVSPTDKRTIFALPGSVDTYVTLLSPVLLARGFIGTGPGPGLAGDTRGCTPCPRAARPSPPATGASSRR